jgi:3'-5' exoribonuclease Rv2179c-like domain
VSSIRDKERNLRSDLLPKATRPDQRCADVYFSADVETDGPIPGPFSILSFALVYAGRFDGYRFDRPRDLKLSFYRELKPISESFEAEALRVNGLDRARLITSGEAPERAMTDACLWVGEVAKSDRPVLVAYPLSFDWSWLYWYFVRFSAHGSPFGYSGCFDIKTAVALKRHIPIGEAGRAQLPQSLRSDREHSHNALDDAFEQAEIFAKVFELEGLNGGGPRSSSK